MYEDGNTNTITLNATDADGDTLTWSIATAASHGTAMASGTGSTKNITYTPNGNYNGTDSFVVRVNDGHGGTDSITITVSVNPVNDAPVNTSVPYITERDESNEPQIVRANIGSTVHANPGTWNDQIDKQWQSDYTPVFTYVYEWQRAYDESGKNANTITTGNSYIIADSSDNHKYIRIKATATDNGYPSSTTESAIAYSGWIPVSNRAPVIKVTGVEQTETSVTMSEDSSPTAFTLTLEGEDLDKDEITWSISSANGDGPSHGTASVTGTGKGTSMWINYIPVLNYNGVDSFVVKISDGHGGEDSIKVNVTINAVNDAPTANNGNLTTNEDSVGNGQLAATDVDGDSLTYSIVTLPNKGTITLNPDGSYTYEPNTNYNGTDSFTFKVNDGTVDSNTATVDITVNPINDAPVNTKAPSYSGIMKVEQVLTADAGEWNDTIDTSAAGTISYSYRWQVAQDINGTGSADISGEISSTHQIKVGEAHKYIRLIVTGTDSGVGTPSRMSTEAASDWKLAEDTVPTVSDVSRTTNEDTDLNFAGIDFSSKFTDSDNDSLTKIKIISLPENGELKFKGNPVTSEEEILFAELNQLAFIPNTNWYGSTSFNWNGYDGATYAAAVAGVNITVISVNDAPEVVGIAKETNEDTALSFTAAEFISKFTDVENDNLVKIQIKSLPANGALSLKGNLIKVNDEIVSAQLGNIIFTPDSNWNGSTSFNWNGYDGAAYAVSDGSVTITVNPINDAPVASTGTLTTAEDTASNGQLTAMDADSSSLTYRILSMPTYGTAVVNSDGTYIYTPNANYNGIDSFTFAVNDGALDSLIAVVSITITPANDAPVNTVIPSHSGTRKVGQDLSGGVGSWNDDMDISVSGTSTISYSYRWQIATDIDGTDSADIAGETSEVYRIKVSDAHKYIRFVVTGTDNGVGIPGIQSTTAYSNWLQVENTAPVTSDFRKKVMENVEVHFTASDFISSFADADNDSMTKIKVTSIPAKGTLKLDGASVKINDEIDISSIPVLVFIPDTSWNGDTSFNWAGFDGRDYSSDSKAEIEVASVNDAPVVSEITKTVDEDTELSFVEVDFSSKFSDVDKDTLITVRIVTLPSNGTLSLNENSVKENDEILLGDLDKLAFMPDSNWNGTSSFKWNGSDGIAYAAQAAYVNITVNPVNDAPKAQDGSLVTDEDTEKSAQLSAIDIDGDRLTYTLVTGTANGTVEVKTDGGYTYKPNLNYIGYDSFTFKVNDGMTDSNTATVTITVTQVNDAPIANDGSLTTDEDTEKSGQLTATDIEGDRLTYVLVTNSLHGTVEVKADGSYIYKPALNYNGPDSFTFKVNDGAVDSNAATVNITVNAVNDFPVINESNPSVVMDEDSNPSVFNLTLTATDYDSDVITWRIVTQGSHGTVGVTGTGNSKEISYIPKENYNGRDSFTVEISDGKDGTAITTVSVEVRPGNDPPINTEPPIILGNVQVGGTLTSKVGTWNDNVDIVPGLITFSYQWQTAENASGLNLRDIEGATGNTYTITPAEANKYIRLKLTATDNGEGVPTNLSTLAYSNWLYNDNIPPIIIEGDSVSVTMDEDGKPRPFILTLNASDANKDVITWSISNPANHGIASVSGTGNSKSIEYTPVLDYVGSDNFTVQVSDGRGGFARCIVTVSVVHSEVAFSITLTSNPTSVVGDGIQTAVLTAVVADSNNKPIEGVEVRFSAPMGTFPSGDTVLTDGEGKALIVYKSPDIGGIVSRLAKVKAEVSDNARNLHAYSEIDVTFEPSSIQGIVYDNDSGELVKGALVKVSKTFGDGSKFEAQMITGPDGRYKIAVPRGKEDYVINITKPVKIGNTSVPVTFTQNCEAGEITGTGKETFDAVNSIAGLVLSRQPDGSIISLEDYSDYNLEVVGKENSSTPLNNSGGTKGVFEVADLEKGKTYTLAVNYSFESGEKITVGKVDVSISNDGQMTISTILIDPYGTITDGVTGSPVSGADVRLYYANTQRNIDSGKTPDTLVILPILPGFEPADNANPQVSDVNGKYGYMVFPTSDYYVTVNKQGYKSYRTETIPVEWEIVKRDIVLSPEDPKQPIFIPYRDVTKPVISLNSASEITLEVFTPYIETVTARDNYDGDLTKKIIVTGSVNTSKLGNYKIIYNVKDSSGNAAEMVTRIVHVVDTTRPVIKLNSPAVMALEVNTPYKETVSAKDNYDGDITSKIVITGSVDTLKPGTYKIAYDVKDTSNNESVTVYRVVYIVQSSRPSEGDKQETPKEDNPKIEDKLPEQPGSKNEQTTPPQDDPIIIDEPKSKAEEIKQATLVKTGRLIDFKSLVGLGALVTAVGAYVLKKKEEEN